MSGLNRHAKQQDVLGTPKNRLVASYFELMDFLEPKYILIEQVGGCTITQCQGRVALSLPCTGMALEVGWWGKEGPSGKHPLQYTPPTLLCCTLF